MIFQPIGGGECGILELGEDRRHFSLGVVIESRMDAQIHAVQRIEAIKAKEIQEVNAHGVGCFAFHKGETLRLENKIALEGQIFFLDGLAKLLGDDSSLAKESEMLFRE